MAGGATLAFAAGEMVDERDASPVLGLGDDLVAEDGAGVLRPHLLGVRPAESAGEHAHELPGPSGLGDLGQNGLPGGIEDDGAHDAIVGRASGRPAGSRS